MNSDRLTALLERVAAGEIAPAAALESLRDLPYQDLGFAKLDLHRELRSGLPEAVFGEGKRPEELEAIADRLIAAHGRLLVTRIGAEVAQQVVRSHPDARYHPGARLLTLGGMPPLGVTVAVITAGTSDRPVAEEAALCSEWCGLEVLRVFDVGIAGVHRLLDRLESIRSADLVIAVAGMDGALPTLLAGLVRTPLIAVPTSVGYGASFQGLAALLTMLNACAPGIAVVNIDNGYGAAIATYRIAAAWSTKSRRSQNIASP